MWGEISGLNKINKIDILPNIFSIHNGMKLEINRAEHMFWTKVIPSNVVLEGEIMLEEYRERKVSPKPLH